MSAGTTDKPAWLWRNAWIFVVLAFLLLVAAWTVFIIIAQKNKPLLVEPPEHASVSG